MTWNPDTRVLKLMLLESGLYLTAPRSCPDPVARQAASLMYYHAEASYFALRPGYTPPRLLEGNSIMNTMVFWASGPAVIQACMDIWGDLMGYHYEHDPEVLNSLQRRCANGLARCGLEEVPGIIAAIEDIDNIP